MKPSYFPVLKGVVRAEGFFFPTSVMPERTCRERILSLWEPGCRVYGFECGYVIFPACVCHVESSTCPGTPVIETQGTFATVELTEGQARDIPDGQRMVTLVIEGELKPFPLSEDHLEEPSQWIDISDYAPARDIHTLGKIPPPPKLSVKPLKKEAKDIFGDAISKASSQKNDLLKYLDTFQKKQAGTVSKSGTGNVPGPRPLSRLARPFLRWILMFSPRGHRQPPSSQTTQTVPPRIKKPRGPGLVSTLLSGFLAGSGLWRFFAGKQARYLKKMMRLFEKGDYENALRYGISLGDASELEKTIASWRKPAPRRDLEISNGNTTYSSSIATDHDTHVYLKTLYEKAFKDLDREGKIEEAAFVLADLIHDNERAVSYLEKNKKLKEAAELAESREMQPGIVVRQWFLCGQIERAVSIAKKNNAFSEAVLHLERTHNQEARMLRLVWAKFLEQSGDYEKAVNVIWPVEEARHLAEQWIDLTIEAGGASAARMLARSLALFQESCAGEKQQGILALIQTILAGSSDEKAFERSVFAKELIKQPHADLTCSLARQVLRVLARDRACLKNGWTPQDFKMLIDFSGDAPIKNEFRKLDKNQLFPQMPKSLASLTEPLVYEFSDKGTHEIHDACMINQNRFLTAHGESGVRMIDKRGNVLAHFNVPAHSLVLSDNGNRAIALAHRGEVFRLSQISITERKASFWYETSLDLYASTFNGAVWFVVTGTTLSAIDVHSRLFQAVWNVTGLPGHVRSLSRSSGRLSLFMDSMDDTESWTYVISGSIFLSDRHYTGPLSESCLTFSVSPSGNVAIFTMDEERQSIVYTLKKKGKTVLEMPISGIDGAIGTPDFSDRWIILPSGDRKTVRFNIIDPPTGKTKLVLSFAETQKINLACDSKTALFSDNHGRIIAVDLDTGALIQDIRF